MSIAIFKAGEYGPGSGVLRQGGDRSLSLMRGLIVQAIWGTIKGFLEEGAKT